MVLFTLRTVKMVVTMVKKATVKIATVRMVLFTEAKMVFEHTARMGKMGPFIIKVDHHNRDTTWQWEEGITRKECHHRVWEEERMLGCIRPGVMVVIME